MALKRDTKAKPKSGYGLFLRENFFQTFLPVEDVNISDLSSSST